MIPIMPDSQPESHLPDQAQPAGRSAPHRHAPRDRFRPQPIAGLVLTPRDSTLLCDLYQHAVMSRRQIQALHFTSTPRCNARLRQLFDFGYVVRHHLPGAACAAPYGIEGLYSIGKAAVPIVARSLQVDPSEVSQGYRRTLTLTFLEHTLEIVNLLLAFRRAVTPPMLPEAALTPEAGTAPPDVAPPGPTPQIDRWLPEMQCRHEYDIRAAGGHWTKEIFKPDAFIRLKRANGDYRNFFIEVDLGHTSSRQFLGKLHTHQRYLESGLFKEIYGGEHFKTLVVTTTEARLQNLLKLVEAENSRLFWFTTFAHITAAPDATTRPKITDDIWQTPFARTAAALL